MQIKSSIFLIILFIIGTLVFCSCTSRGFLCDFEKNNLLEEDISCLPVVIHFVAAAPREEIKLKINGETIYEKINNFRYPKKYWIGILDTIHLNKPTLGAKFNLTVESIWKNHTLIDTTWSESLNFLGDLKVRVSSPLPLVEAWENRKMPLERYLLDYPRSVKIIRNAREKEIEMLKPK